MTYWAKELGYNNPSTLSSTLNGRRPFGLKIRAALKKFLSLNLSDEQYFEVLADLSNAKSPQEKIKLQEYIEEKNLGLNIESMDLEKFRVISDWYYLAILEALKMEEINSVADLFQLIKPNINYSQIVKAVKRMCGLGMITLDDDGKIDLVDKAALYKTGDQVPNE